MLIGIVSPYSGPVEENEKYLRRCMALVLAEGHTPVAGHAYLPHVLDDNDPSQREHGMRAGQELLVVCQEVHVFCDSGISAGMWQDIEHAIGLPKLILLRSVNGGFQSVTAAEIHVMRNLASEGINIMPPPWTSKEGAND